MDEEGSSVIRCLQDYLTEIKDEKCKEQVWMGTNRWATSPFSSLLFHPPESLLLDAHPTPIFTPHTETSQVRKYQELAAEDIRFDVPLADACYEDRQRFCASVPPVGVGGWRVWGMPRKGVAQGGVKLL